MNPLCYHCDLCNGNLECTKYIGRECSYDCESFETYEEHFARKERERIEVIAKQEKRKSNVFKLFTTFSEM